MIQKWIKETLETAIPHLEWTFDYVTGQDDTGVVYNESAGQPSQDDFEMLFPTYTVYVESSNMDQAEIDAWKVHELMNKRRNGVAVIQAGLEFDVIFIEIIAPPIPGGIDNKKITYSINLRTTIRRK